MFAKCFIQVLHIILCHIHLWVSSSSPKLLLMLIKCVLASITQCLKAIPGAQGCRMLSTEDRLRSETTELLRDAV